MKKKKNCVTRYTVQMWQHEYGKLEMSVLIC